MNKIKFLTHEGVTTFIRITQNKASILGFGSTRSKLPSRRQAFILAARKGLTHPEMFVQI